MSTRTANFRSDQAFAILAPSTGGACSPGPVRTVTSDAQQRFEPRGGARDSLTSAHRLATTAAGELDKTDDHHPSRGPSGLGRQKSVAGGERALLSGIAPNI